MKKLLLPFLALLFLISCGKENSTELVSEENSAVNNNNYENGSATSRTPAPKIDVCHHDDEKPSVGRYWAFLILRISM
jgi:hypothetical protein